MANLNKESNREFAIVVAVDVNNGIGKGGKLPWHITGDMQYFKQLTTTSSNPELVNAVIMGRKTWESIPEKRRPLANRMNIIITRNIPVQKEIISDVKYLSSLDDALSLLAKYPIDKCFVIGGGEIYKLALQDPRCRELYITEIRSTFDCDTFFPDYKNNFDLFSASEIQRENETGIEYCFKRFIRRRFTSDE